MRNFGKFLITSVCVNTPAFKFFFGNVPDNGIYVRLYILSTPCRQRHCYNPNKAMCVPTIKHRHCRSLRHAALASLPWRHCPGVTALASLPWRHCPGVTALASLPWRHCPGVTALASLPWRHCPGVTALASLPWRHCPGVTALASLPWRHCPGVTALASLPFGEIILWHGGNKEAADMRGKDYQAYQPRRWDILTLTLPL